MLTGATFRPAGEVVLTSSVDNTARIWRAYTQTQTLVDLAKDAASRCLTPQERRQFFLNAAPPRWCITGVGQEQEKDATRWEAKPPYESPEWRQWLAAADAARAAGQKQPPPPTPADGP